MSEPKFAIQEKLGEYKIIEINYKNLEFEETEEILELDVGKERIIDSEPQISTSFNSSPYADYPKEKPKRIF